MKNLFLSIMAVITIASCSAIPSLGKSKVGASQTNIVNTQWTLADNVSGKKPTLIVENGKISGNAGCNNYFGQLSLDPTAGNFNADKIGSTRMACDNLASEKNFLDMLDEADKYVVTDNTLELYKGNLLLLKFTKM